MAKALSSTSHGFGRLLVTVYAIFALAATARSLFQLITRGSQAPLAYSLSAIAALIYIAATWAMATDRRTVAQWSVAFEAVGVFTIGAASVLVPSLFADQTVWSQFGQGYGYLPLVLPPLAFWWLRRGAGSGKSGAGER